MILGILSDVHANLPALRAVQRELNSTNVEDVVICGDIVGAMGWPRFTIEAISDWTHRVVYGNHDARHMPGFQFDPNWGHERAEQEFVSKRLTESQIRWLSELPARIETDELVVAHSWPVRFRDHPSSFDGFAPDDHGVSKRLATKAGVVANGRIVALGHTHQSFALELGKFEGQSGTIVNPGSVGQPLGEPAEYAIADTDSGSVELCETEYDYEVVEERMDAMGITSDKKNV